MSSFKLRKLSISQILVFKNGESLINLNNNPINSIYGLRNLKQLNHLHLAKTEITVCGVLNQMPLLETLRLHNCKYLSSLKPVSYLKNLKRITVPRYRNDYYFLKKLKKLKSISDNDVLNKAELFWKKYNIKN